jgi:hypothetical protein
MDRSRFASSASAGAAKVTGSRMVTRLPRKGPLKPLKSFENRAKATVHKKAGFGSTGRAAP